MVIDSFETFISRLKSDKILVHFTLGQSFNIIKIDEENDLLVVFDDQKQKEKRFSLTVLYKQHLFIDYERCNSVDGCKNCYNKHECTESTELTENDVREMGIDPSGYPPNTFKKDDESVNVGNKVENSYNFDHEMIGYDALFKKMDEADETKIYSHFFWHLTHYLNLVKILKDGYLLSRYDCADNIPYDNKKMNSTSREVLTHHKSYLTEHYVRLYFRPKNKPYWNMKNCMSSGRDTNLAIISFRRELIQKSPNPVILFYKNAVFAEREDLDWHYAINSKKIVKIKNFDRFDFKNIYKKYNVNETDAIKQIQCAECLIYNKLSIEFIDNIYFSSFDVMNEFLNELKNQISNDKFYFIKNKCSVNTDMFYNNN